MQKKACLWLALVIPILIHGFYDFCLSIDSFALEIAFYVFVIALYVFAFSRVKNSSQTDRSFTSAAGRGDCR